MSVCTGDLYLTYDEDGGLTYTCRCVVCVRCNQHTGNSNQGHFWAYCKVARRDVGAFHFCCPDDCEMHPAGAA